MINFESLREYCLSLKGTEESFPFNETTLVFKAGGKMYMLLDLESDPPEFNVKCDPAKAIELRERYDFVKPGFHMNKTHWNTVSCSHHASQKLIFEFIHHSYEQVVKNLPKSVRQKLTK